MATRRFKRTLQARIEQMSKVFQWNLKLEEIKARERRRKQNPPPANQ